MSNDPRSSSLTTLATRIREIADHLRNRSSDHLNAIADELDTLAQSAGDRGSSDIRPIAPPINGDWPGAVERLHRLLEAIEAIDAIIDPEVHPEIQQRIDAELHPCDVADHCPTLTPDAPAGAREALESVELRETIEHLALRYHKDIEGEYGCPGLTCPGVQRLYGFAMSVLAAAALPVPALDARREDDIDS